MMSDAELREKARAHYAPRNIKVPTRAEICRIGDAAWVRAWVPVPQISPGLMQLQWIPVK